MEMQLGQRVRELRDQQGFTQKDLGERIGVSVSYISKVENDNLHFGDYPSEKFIHKLVDELDADEDELLLLSDRVPEALRKRIRERPEVFNAVVSLDDRSLDKLVKQIGSRPRKRKTR